MKILEIFVKNTIYANPMVFMPLGLAWIRAVLTEAGHDVDYIDMSEYAEDAQGNHINVYPEASSIPLDYDLYLISGTTPQAREINSVGKFLKEKGKPAIVGGPHSSNYAGPETPKGSLMMFNDSTPVDKNLVSNYPVMVKYEGEEAIFEAIERMEEGMRAQKNYGRGIVLKGEIIKDLDKLPIPDRRESHKYKYHFSDKDGIPHLSTTMFTSRGCPKRCAFCDSPGLWTRAVRYIPAHRVIEDLAQIKKLGFEGILFSDDILPLHRGRMIEICKGLKEMVFTWRCNLRVDIMCHPKYGKDFLGMMQDSGCDEILVGVESGSQQILDNIYKDTTIEQNNLVRRWCKELGIRFRAAICLGFPGETMETMEATRQWLQVQRPDRCALAMFIPFRGTPIVDQKMRKQYGMDDMHVFDINVGEQNLEDFDDFAYYAPKKGIQSLVSTSSLTSQQITDFYLELLAWLDSAGIVH